MALFKIFNNIDSEHDLPETHTKGYMYFDAKTGVFYIDTASDGDPVESKRMAVNSWGALKAENDNHVTQEHPYGQPIAATYIKALSTTGTQITVTKGDGTTSTVALTGAEKVKITDTTPAAATSYYPVYASSTSGVQELRANTDLYYWDNGTSSYLNIGSSNHLGGLSLHSANGKYANLTPSSFTANRSLIIPDKDGTLAITTDLDVKANINSPTFTGIPTAPTADAGTNNTQIATTAFVMNAFTTNDALIFKGTINSNSDLPATHKQGWTYKIATAGTYAGQVCEVGDTIYCVTDGTAANNAHWVVVQTNIDGAVTGPASSIVDHIATFTGTTGKAIQDSGILVTSLAPKASPALTGTPTAPTAAASTSSTQIATTAFVHAAIMSYLYDGSSQVVT